MSTTETDIRAYVKAVFATEFAPESFVAVDDTLLRAAGKDGAAHAAVNPVVAEENPRQVIQLDVQVQLQLYLPYEAEPDETRVVDPTVIEGYAGRIRTMLAPSSAMATANLWGLRVTRIDYPPDPNGKATRLEALIRGYADNPAALGP